MLDRFAKSLALLLVAQLWSAADAPAEEYSIKIPVTEVVNVSSPSDETSFPQYGQLPAVGGNSIQSVQATETLPLSYGALQGLPAPNPRQNDRLSGDPVIEGGPQLVGPNLPASPDLGATAVIPPVATPMLSGPVILDTAATVIPTGCPTCECVVCQCPSPSCPPFVPIGNICGSSCCCPCWWVRAEALAWYLRGDYVPPLVTTSPNGWPAGVAGVLGEPNTSTLYGGNRDGAVRIGGRITSGFWFDPCRRHGMQVEFWGLNGLDNDYYVDSDGDPVLARPFYNTETGAQDAQILAYPGLASGSIDVDTNGQMYSAAALWRFNTKCCTKCCRGKKVTQRCDFLVGYRYWHFDEDLTITERLEPMGAFYAPGTVLTLTDQIETDNDFHGAEFGLEWQRQCGKWICELGASIASGRMRRKIRGVGTTNAYVPNAMDQTVDGGFYVPASGIHARNTTGTVIPQGRIGLGYYVRPCLRLHAGYDFLFVNDVVRPSSALNTAFPGSRLASGGVPGDNVYDWHETDVWAQGISLGMTLNY